MITAYINNINQRYKLGNATEQDRKGRKLDFEDIQHYQKIIVALTETDRLMKEIDGVEIA